MSHSHDGVGSTSAHSRTAARKCAYPCWMFGRHFSPHVAERRPCWHCTQFVGMVAAGSAAKCSLPNGPRVRSIPAHGCSAWERETGADDDLTAAPVGFLTLTAQDRFPASTLQKLYPSARC